MKDQLLDAAFDIVVTDGFGKLTARNIAAKVHCSTQPIYLEFSGGMNELRDTLFQNILDYLTSNVFSNVDTGETVKDISLNYINFANEETDLYRSLYVDTHFHSQHLYDYMETFSLDQFEAKNEFSSLSRDEKTVLFNGVWIVSSGIANLSTSGQIKPSRQEIILAIDSIIDSVLKTFSKKL